MHRIPSRVSKHGPELAASLGLASLYLAVMSGHLASIDGLVMWRQAISVVRDHSFSFVPPIWWGGYISNSGRGMGASMQYFPAALLAGWLSPHSPAPGAAYDFGLLYGDKLYAVAGAPVWALVAACTALLAGLITRKLVHNRSATLWAIAFYGLGSPALAASRGDTPQPLVALCWALGVFACLKYNEANGRRWLWVSGAAVFYAVLTRPLEGSLLLPGVLALLMLPAWRTRLAAGAVQVAFWTATVLATLLLDWVRFGSPFNLGYPGSVAWTTPLWYGFPSALVSPGRGLLWEFPALALALVGAVYLWRNGLRIATLVLAGLPAVLFLEACQYFDWVGGWDWGFRFIQPALPLLAALAGMGAVALPARLRSWLPAVLLAGGIVWNIPAVTTDILGGYGAAYADGPPNWRLDAYPPIGAWRFLHHLLPVGQTDGSSLDIVWFRAARVAGKAALAPFVILLAAGAALWAWALRAEPGSGQATR